MSDEMHWETEIPAWTGNYEIDATIKIFIDQMASKLDIFDIKKILGDVENLAAAIAEAIANANQALLNAIKGIAGTTDDILKEIGDILKGKWDKIDSNEEELASLQDAMQELLGVIGYGNFYMNKTHTWSLKEERMKYDQKIGPLVGCRLDNQGIILESKGLWEISAQTWFDYYAIGVKGVSLQVRVFAPNGSLIATRSATGNSGDAISLYTEVPVVVPTAGYRVEIWASSALGRGILGGSARNGVSVKKISQEED